MIPYPIRKNLKFFLRTEQNAAYSDLLQPLERSRKFIFNHVPRTGGTSMAVAIFGQESQHRALRELIDFDYFAVTRFYIFSVVRDPIDRFVSAFEFISRGGMNVHDLRAKNLFLDPLNCDINDFVSEYFIDPTRTPPHLHFLPQMYYVSLNDTACWCDFLVTFPRMEEAWYALARYLNLPHSKLGKLNSSGVSNGRGKSLTAKSHTILSDFFSADIVMYESCMKLEAKFPLERLISERMYKGRDFEKA